MGLKEALSNPLERLSSLVREAIAHPRTRTKPSVPRSQRRLLTDEIDELVRSYRAGMTVRQLTDYYGIHRVTIAQLLREHQVDRLPYRKPDPDWAEEAKRLHTDGMSLRELGRRFGVSREKVRRYVIGRRSSD